MHAIDLTDGRRRGELLTRNKRAKPSASSPFAFPEPQIGELISLRFELNAGGGGDHLQGLLDVRLSIGCQRVCIE